ncbi:MAG: hypothetical protein ABR559_09000 [Gemmatimonadota bacterium]
MGDEQLNEELDFTMLDPSRDRDRWERLVGQITARATPFLSGYREAPRAARQAERSPVLYLAGWLRPALAAAATIALLAAGTLLATRTESVAAPVATVAEALGYPAPVTAWVEAGRVPSVEELAITLEASP